MEKLKILFLAANPIGTSRLRIDKEARVIWDKLLSSPARDQVELETRWAVRPDDLIRELNDYQPHIVHFSGHGEKQTGLVLLGDREEALILSARALEAIFRALKDQIRLVVLNACYSADQAAGILKSIDFVVGMNARITDAAAEKFSSTFYRAIACARSLQNAFEQGQAAIMAYGLPGDQSPQLFACDGQDPAEAVLLSLASEAEQATSELLPGSVVPEKATDRAIPRSVSVVTHTLSRSSLSTFFPGALAVTPDGTFAVSTAFRHLQLWDLVNFRSLRLIEVKEVRPPYPRSEASIDCIAVDAAGSRALIGSRSHGLILIDLNSLEYLKFLPELYVYGAAVSVDWSLVAAVTERNKILIWNLDSEQITAEMAVPTRWFDTFVSNVAIADGGGFLLTSCDRNLMVWDLKSGKQLRTLYGHSKQVTRVMATRDARLAVSASNDKTLKIWEPLDGRELCSLAGHTDAVNDVAITPDGRLAASASEDKTVKVWDLKVRSEVCTLRGSEPLKAVCMTENGMRIVGLSSKYLTVWDL